MVCHDFILITLKFESQDAILNGVTHAVENKHGTQALDLLSLRCQLLVLHGDEVLQACQLALKTRGHHGVEALRRLHRRRLHLGRGVKVGCDVWKRRSGG